MFKREMERFKNEMRDSFQRQSEIFEKGLNNLMVEIERFEDHYDQKLNDLEGRVKKLEGK